MPLVAPPLGKHMMPTRDEALSSLESDVMTGLDPDKLSELAEVLFAFNNYQIGPMPGFYVALEVEAGTRSLVNLFVEQLERLFAV